MGSILAITDADGDVIEERQFGAWGIVDQFSGAGGSTTFDHTSLLGRGYTGHEHFFEVGLIHMNGRMYDAKLGRFLSPDNYVQEPFNTQSYNRYGYVLNNPLMYTDPSGEFFFCGGETALLWWGIGALAALLTANVAINSGWFDGGSAYAPTSYANPAPTPSNNRDNSQVASSLSTGQMALNDGGLIPLNIPAVETGGGSDISSLTFGNASFTHVSPFGVSQTGSRISSSDPLQGIPRPNGFTPTDGANDFMQQDQGFTITAEDVLDTAMDFIPFVGSFKDIYKGIRDGDGFQLAIGVGSLLLDIVTAGSASIIKGGIKTGLKAGGKSLVRNTTKKGRRVFWSGGDHAMNTAMKFAQKHGMKTLEMTKRGKLLSKMDRLLPRSVMAPLWRSASKSFARGAKGPVNVFH
ncbi:MAG: RHS repeat-associated core domain-containing protein, partial [Bacteroidota bacterium]